MSYSSFSDYKVKNPTWENTYGIYQRDALVYKRLVCRWKENDARNHEFHACINTQTGDIYLDCRKRKIFAKHLALAIARPLHTCIKTLWHATLIGPLALEIFKVMQGKQTLKDLGKNTLKSLADIVRTPVYGLAMTITNLVGLILGVVSPNTLYETRAIAGKLEREMLRVDHIFKADKMWQLSPCFSPIKRFLTKHEGKYVERTREDLDQMLLQFAKSNIKFRRKYPVIFNDCGRLLPADKEYISSAKKIGTAHFCAWLEQLLPPLRPLAWQ